MASTPEINTAVNADLHPDNLLHIAGLDDDTRPLIAPAVEAFESAYAYLGSIHDVRKAAFGDPTLTPEAALLRTDDFAQSKLGAVTQKFDNAVAQFTRTIDALESDLNGSVKEEASKAVSGEVRALMKGSENRLALLQQAMAEGDNEVLSAVLGAPPMLSGLTKEMHAVLLRNYNAKRKPETTKRLNALVAARTQLENKGGLVLLGMDKAVGSIPVVEAGKNGKQHMTRTITPREVRSKRDASNAVYAKHA